MRGVRGPQACSAPVISGSILAQRSSRSTLGRVQICVTGSLDGMAPRLERLAAAEATGQLLREQHGDLREQLRYAERRATAAADQVRELQQQLRDLRRRQ